MGIFFDNFLPNAYPPVLPKKLIDFKYDNGHFSNDGAGKLFSAVIKTIHSSIIIPKRENFLTE